MSGDRLFIHPVSVALNRDVQLFDVNAEFVDLGTSFTLTAPFAAINVSLRSVEGNLSLADGLAKRPHKQPKIG